MKTEEYECDSCGKRWNTGFAAKVSVVRKEASDFPNFERTFHFCNGCKSMAYVIDELIRENSLDEIKSLISRDN